MVHSLNQKYSQKNIQSFTQKISLNCQCLSEKICKSLVWLWWLRCNDPVIVWKFPLNKNCSLRFLHSQKDNITKTEIIHKKSKLILFEALSASRSHLLNNPIRMCFSTNTHNWLKANRSNKSCWPIKKSTKKIIM